MNKLIATLIVSTGIAAAAPFAFAQSAPDASQATPAPRAGGMHRHHFQRAHRSASERIEARLAYIRTALKITDAQQPQWENFANVLRKQAQQTDEFRNARRAERGQQRPQGASAIERLERRQKMMSVASQRLDEVIAAAKPLYAALSPEQQKVADELMARRGHGGKGHFHGARRGA
jgi:hypothetical protein